MKEFNFGSWNKQTYNQLAPVTKTRETLTWPRYQALSLASTIWSICTFFTTATVLSPAATVQPLQPLPSNPPNSQPCNASLLATARRSAFHPFSPKSSLSLPDACCRDTNMLLLLSSPSKQRQEGKRLTVCLVPYATWQQSPLIWPEFGPEPGALFYLFYSLLPCICLCHGHKSLSGPHQTGLTVGTQPENGAIRW